MMVINPQHISLIRKYEKEPVIDYIWIPANTKTKCILWWKKYLPEGFYKQNYWDGGYDLISEEKIIEKGYYIKDNIVWQYPYMNLYLGSKEFKISMEYNTENGIEVMNRRIEDLQAENPNLQVL